ncbi:MAG: NAD-dependent epimerase/dehydratase family protein [Paludibacter sp.]
MTGATGFLGSHIAENLLSHGFELIVAIREKSTLDNCQSFYNSVTWVNTDTDFWINKVIESKPDIIVHAAWNGVSATNREDWKSQLTNIDFMWQLMKIARESNVRKFISLGSQAEYGQFEGKISEDYPLNPTSSYGAIKLAVLEMLKVFCNENEIKWYWLRVFSVFGERENEHWLIPSVIKKMLSDGNEMNFTLGEQKYAYLYVADFAKSISNVVMKDAPSGIYNLSSDNPIRLKELLKAVRDIVNPNFDLRFGVIPYRLNQSMHIEGDSTKFNQAFGQIDSSNFKIKLEHVINSYKN